VLAQYTQIATALTYAHRVAGRADYSNDGGRTWTPIPHLQAASVTADRTAGTRYSASVTLDGVALGRDGINEISTNIRLFTGIVPVRGSTVWVPSGRYAVATHDETRTGLSLALDGIEDDVRADEFPTPRVIESDTAEAVAALLLGESLPGVPIAWQPGVNKDYILPQQTIDQDRWAALAGATDSEGNSLGVAAALGAELYADARGAMVFAPVPTLADDVVWRIGQGRGNALIMPQPSGSRDGYANLWAVSGETDTTDGTGAPTTGAVGPVYAWDDDPASLSYAGPDPIGDPLAPQRLGLYGVRVRPKRYASPLIRDGAAAQTKARALLADSLGVQAALSFDAVCNPCLEPGDVVEVEVKPGVWQRHLIDSLRWDIGKASMACATRTSTRRVA